MRTIFLITLILFSTLSPAHAVPLSVRVSTPDGQPIADAVVSISEPSKIQISGAKFPWPLRVAQRDLEFDPYVLIVPIGAQVAFPNFDSVSHHVYSFSPAKSFEIKLYGKDESRSVSFPSAGVVAIGCNIHDSMSAYVYVSDTPLVAKTGTDGTATIADAPNGAVTISIWHPNSGALGQRIAVAVPADARGNPTQITLQLRAKRRSSHGY